MCSLIHWTSCMFFLFFFFNDTATTEIYTLSLHDALPIYAVGLAQARHEPLVVLAQLREHVERRHVVGVDRKSTRLNSSHVAISYAVFCLKKKNKDSSILWSTTIKMIYAYS